MPEVVIGVKRFEGDGSRLDPNAGRDEGVAVYAMWMRYGDAVITAKDGLKSVETTIGNQALEVTVTLLVSGIRTVDELGDEQHHPKAVE